MTTGYERLPPEVEWGGQKFIKRYFGMGDVGNVILEHRKNHIQFMYSGYTYFDGVGGRKRLYTKITEREKKTKDYDPAYDRLTKFTDKLDIKKVKSPYFLWDYRVVHTLIDASQSRSIMDN